MSSRILDLIEAARKTGDLLPVCKIRTEPKLFKEFEELLFVNGGYWAGYTSLYAERNYGMRAFYFVYEYITFSDDEATYDFCGDQEISMQEAIEVMKVRAVELKEHNESLLA